MSRASDIAYQEIRRRIIGGELPPGSQLKEEELADLCGVSRTPVRDALRRLEAEMLIRRSDTQRTFVPEWSYDDLNEIFDLRTLLESQAARRAALHVTPAQLDALKACSDAVARAVHRMPYPDVDGFVTENRIFHDIIFKAARSERLARMSSLIVEQLVVYRTAARYDRSDFIRSQNDHEELTVALAKGDPEWAASIMTNHIRRAAHAYFDGQDADSRATALRQAVNG